MLFGSKKILGLDIGSSTIKIAELEVGRNGAQLNYFGFLPMPQGAVGGGDFTNTQMVADAIRTLHGQSKGNSKDIAVGMWGTSVIVKKIAMPRVEKKLIQQQIRWEAEQYIPFDPNEISLAYHLLPGGGSPDTQDLLLIAAQNAMVNQYRQIISGAGLKLAILDVSGFALANAFELNYGKLTGQTVALINIGSAVTNFVVVHDGEVIFSRDIPFGGSNFTTEIHKEMGLTTPEAEALKLSAVMGNEVPEQVHSILNAVNENMVEEIRNSFDFFSASNAGYAINRAYYTGGSATMPNLISRASQVSNLPFDQINPFARVRPGRSLNSNYLQQIAPFASVVIGLAARKAKE